MHSEKLICILVLARSLGVLQNAEHSHALAGNNHLYHVALDHEPFLFFFNLVFSLDSNPHVLELSPFFCVPCRHNT
jgi:hypothetical protein